MDLFTLQNCCVSRSLNILKIKLDSQYRLTIPEFSGYHCIWTKLKLQTNIHFKTSLMLPSLNLKLKIDYILMIFTAMATPNLS